MRSSLAQRLLTVVSGQIVLDHDRFFEAFCPGQTLEFILLIS